MRLSKWVVFFCFLVYFFSFQTLNAQEKNASSKAEEGAPQKMVTILLGRAVDAAPSNDNPWMPGLLEAALEFKFAAIGNIAMISPSDVSVEVKDHANLLKIPGDDEYIRAAKKLQADYYVNQKYELARNKNFSYYAEIISVSTGELKTTVEKVFKLEDFGTGIDDVVGLYMLELEITPPRELARFLRLPVVGTNTKSFTALGMAITKERFQTGVDLLQLADEYRVICEKDRSLLLGYYRAGLFFEVAGKFSDATEALNFLFMTAPEYTPVYLPLARNFRKAKRYQDAVRIALLGLKRGVMSSELSSELAMANNAMGKKTEGEAIFNAILESNPDDPFALLFDARKKNDEGKAAEALALGDRLLKTNTERGQTQVERGRSLTLLGRKDEAIIALKEATKLLPSEVNPMVYLGDLYNSTQQYQKAVEQYEGVLKRAPENVELFLKAADAAKNAGDPKKALALLYSIESRATNNGKLQKEIGLLELSNGDSAKAITHLEAGVRAGDEDVNVLTQLGWLLIKRKDYDKALNYMSKALLLVKDKDPIRAGLVLIYLNKGDLSTAMSTLESMKSNQNTIPNLNRMLGDAFVKNKQNEKALVYYRKEFAANSSDTALKSFIADLSYNYEPAVTANNEYLQVVKMGAGGATALYRLTILSLRLKSSKTADFYLDKAMNTGDADAPVWYEIGIGFAQLGITSKAIKSFEECLKKDPSMEEAWIEMASLLIASKKDSAAAEAYMKLYELNKSKNKEYLVQAAQLFDKSGASLKAVEVYSTAADKNSIDEKGTVRLAELEFEKGNFKEVLSLLENLSAASINVKEAKLLAESYFALGKFEQALPHLKFINSKNSKDIRAIELLARVNDTLGNTEEAAEYYSNYLLIIGKNGDYAFRLGELYEKLDRQASAIKQYLDNTRIYPDEYRNFDRLARLYVSTGKMTNAIPILKKAVNFKEAQSDLNGLLANALALSGGGGAEAVAQFETYLESNEKDYDGWAQLGTLHYSKKKYGDAVTAYEKAVSIKNTDLRVLKNLADAYIKTENINKAIDILSRARNLKMDDTEILTMLAGCYRTSGDNKKLIEVLYELSGYDKKSYDLRVELGNLLVKENRTKDAIAVYEDAALLRKCQVELHLKVARLYEEEKNDERWLFHINAATVCSPRDANLNMELGRYYYNRKEYTKADAYLQTALKANVKLHEAYFLLGSSLMEQKKFSNARVYLQKASQLNPESSEYRISLAELYYNEGNTAGALKAISPVMSESKLEPSVLRIAGLIYKAAGKVDTAFQILNDAIASNSKCAECYAALGDLHFDNTDFENAAKSYQKSIDIDGFEEYSAGKLANSYMKLKKNDQARKLLDEIIQNNPKNSEAIYRMSHLHIINRDFDTVEKLLNASTTPKDGWYYLTKGELDEVQGKIDDATIAYTKALKTLSNVTEVQAGCGRINLIKKRYANAIAYLGQAMGGDPENVQLYLDLGKAYEGSGDLSTSLEFYKEVETRMPDHPEVHYCMARVLSKNNNHKEAIEALFTGINRNKKNVLLYMALGHEFRMTQEPDKAIDAYIRATKVDETQAVDAYKYIGSIYSVLKDEKKAKRYYEMYINAGGQDKEVKQYLQIK